MERSVNILRPRRNEQHFADAIFKRIFINENVSISIKVSLKFVSNDPINNTPALVQIMAWRRPGDTPLSEPMMFSLLTHKCVTRPQWVNTLGPGQIAATLSDFFKCISLNENLWILNTISRKYVPLGPNLQHDSIGSDNGSAPNRGQAIMLSNIVTLCWRRYTSLSLIDLTHWGEFKIVQSLQTAFCRLQIRLCIKLTLFWLIFFWHCLPKSNYQWTSIAYDEGLAPNVVIVCKSAERDENNDTIVQQFQHCVRYNFGCNTKLIIYTYFFSKISITHRI